MKILVRFILLSLCITLLSSCNTINNDKHIDLEKINEEGSKSITVITNDDSNNTGTYMYDYENDTENLIEDHYIVLEAVNGKLEGRYYGTSDDFDEAREGYYPGFFVSNMQYLQIRDDEITFIIDLQKSDLFSKQVILEYKASEEVPLTENPIWVNSNIVEGSDKNPRNYKGKIVDGEILLELENGPRVFKRIK
jgi:hypothetical protein